MQLLTLALLPGLISASVLAPRADCTAQVTPSSTVTVSTYTNKDVFYTTSVVTVYARPSTTASPAKRHVPAPVPLVVREASAPESSSPSASSYSEAACAVTETMPAPTTTVTTTYTFSHAARATQTAAACAAHNVFNGTVSYNTKQTRFAVGQPRGEVMGDINDGVGCCNKCFDGTCMWYIFDNIDQDGSWVHGCKIYWSDGSCPNGVGKTEALRMENDDGDRGISGLGPCLVEVGYYQSG